MLPVKVAHSAQETSFTPSARPENTRLISGVNPLSLYSADRIKRARLGCLCPLESGAVMHSPLTSSGSSFPQTAALRRHDCPIAGAKPKRHRATQNLPSPLVWSLTRHALFTRTGPHGDCRTTHNSNARPSPCRTRHPHKGSPVASSGDRGHLRPERTSDDLALTHWVLPVSRNLGMVGLPLPPEFDRLEQARLIPPALGFPVRRPDDLRPELRRAEQGCFDGFRLANPAKFRQDGLNRGE